MTPPLYLRLVAYSLFALPDFVNRTNAYCDIPAFDFKLYTYIYSHPVNTEKEKENENEKEKTIWGKADREYSWRVAWWLPAEIGLVATDTDV